MNEKQAIAYIRCHHKYYQRHKKDEDDDLPFTMKVFFVVFIFLML